MIETAHGGVNTGPAAPDVAGYSMPGTPTRVAQARHCSVVSKLAPLTSESAANEASSTGLEY